MNDDETLVPDHAQRDFSHFAVVFLVIQTSQNLAFENQGGINDINATFFEDQIPFPFIPLEIHLSYSFWW